MSSVDERSDCSGAVTHASVHFHADDPRAAALGDAGRGRGGPCARICVGAAAGAGRVDGAADPRGGAGGVGAAALGENFEVAERALVLVEAAAETPGDRRAELVAFGRGLAAAIEADAVAGLLTRSVIVEPGADAAAWIREEVTPAALHFLDEAALTELTKRLSPEGLAARTRRVASLLEGGAPGRRRRSRRRSPTRSGSRSCWSPRPSGGAGGSIAKPSGRGRWSPPTAGRCCCSWCRRVSRGTSTRRRPSPRRCRAWSTARRRHHARRGSASSGRRRPRPTARRRSART